MGEMGTFNYFRSNSAQPLFLFQTYHYQAQLIEKYTPYGAGVPV
jgi:hypothetical protein